MLVPGIFELICSSISNHMSPVGSTTRLVANNVAQMSQISRYFRFMKPAGRGSVSLVRAAIKPWRNELLELTMKKTVALLAGISLSAIAAPAFAQDGGATFTGPRVEALVGYDITSAGSSVDDDANEDNDQSIDGLLYGVGVGYDVDLGGMVVGAEAELTDSTAKVGFDDGDFEGFGFGSVKAGRDLYLGARAGVKASPDMLIYAKGGYTNAKFDVLSNDGTTEFSQDIDTDGFRIGAGAEYAMSENSFIKLEYRYSNYSKAEIDFDGDLPDADRFDVDLDRHQVAASYGFRF